MNNEKYWGVIDEEGKFLQLQDVRQTNGKTLRITSISIYPTAIDANRMSRYIKEAFDKEVKVVPLNFNIHNEM